jgi:riboflavin synthase
MFTGLVEEVGRVAGVTRKGGILRLLISADRVREDLSEGSSIAVNGVCLTVTGLSRKRFSVEAGGQTQRTTTIRRLRVGDEVNLERAMTAQSRFGGHIVAGHVDGVTSIKSRKEEAGSVVYEFRMQPEWRPYFVDRGSVAVDGVSFTISALQSDSFSVTVVPFTQKSTTFGSKRAGNRVNVELDMIAKYVVDSVQSEQGYRR